MGLTTDTGSDRPRDFGREVEKLSEMVEALTLEVGKLTRHAPGVGCQVCGRGPDPGGWVYFAAKVYAGDGSLLHSRSVGALAREAISDLPAQAAAILKQYPRSSTIELTFTLAADRGSGDGQPDSR